MIEVLGIEKFLDPWYGLVGLLGMGAWFIFEWIFPSFSLLNIFSSNKVSFKSKTLIVFSIVTGIVGWIMLVVSIMKPVKVVGYSKKNIEVRDIFFVVDVSRSMLANDFSPNRLEVAKKYISGFIDMRPYDRIAVIMFAEKILTLNPLTFDYNSLKEKVSEIKVGFLGNGTNIGDGLGLAVQRLKVSDVKGKVIILLTDGVSNVGNITPLQATEFAIENNVKVYSIAIGTKGKAQIPYKVAGKTMYQNIPGGNVDEETLRKISSQTGGVFYSASSEKALLEIFRKISKLEKTKVKGNQEVNYAHLYHQYLMWGAMLFLISEYSRRKVSLFAV